MEGLYKGAHLHLNSHNMESALHSFIREGFFFPSIFVAELKNGSRANRAGVARCHGKDRNVVYQCHLLA